MTNTRERQLIARIAELEAENQVLRARIADLEQQVSKLLAASDFASKIAYPRICQTESTETSSQKAGAKTGTRRQLPTSSHQS